MSDILLAAFALSLVLLGMHSYFGLEIIRRGIIFTDLAVGQMAALGASISILFFDGKFIYPISLVFALIAGIVIAYTARRDVHLEAFIGLLYAFGFSGVYMILSKSYHGMEEFQKLMASDILFTPTAEIIRTAVLYAVLGVLVFLSRRKTKGTLQEMLFFIIFSITVTVSVRLAGVLVVFALLVAPALIALKCGFKKPLLFAWAIGTVVNLVAILASYRLDLPTGYAIVFFNALAALAVSAAKPKPVESREKAG